MYLRKLSVLVLLAVLLSGCTEASAAQESFTRRDLDSSYTDVAGSITLAGNAIETDAPGVNVSGTTATITKAGTYLLSGSLKDGQIVVNAAKTDKIQLVLQGVHLTCQSSAAIEIQQADKVFLTLEQENTLRSEAFPSEPERNVDAVIFSKEDLTLNGTGSLIVDSPAGHGIVSKDDLVITGGSYQITAASHALSGKDSVRIADGSFTLTAEKDGIHAENSDDAALGNVTISGGSFAITTQGDGISASGDLEVTGGDYTISAGGGSENAATHSVSFQGERGGMREKGAGGFGRKDAPPSAVSSATVQADSASTKGIRAGGNLTISGGSFVIDAADDALHTNASAVISGGSFQISTGDDGIHADDTLTVEGGKIAISQSYEGLEALHLNISGGDITLTATDDGLNAAGGMDQSGFGGRDGRFGGQGTSSGSIVISGGKLHITASGDGIDANGSLEISGGETTVCGPIQGDTSTLDYDTTATITGGTFLGSGAATMAQTFSSSQNQGVLALQTGNASAGTAITVTDSQGKTLLQYTPELPFAVLIFSNSSIQKGATYTVQIGSQSANVQAR